MLVIATDEAGYGPKLGPLVIAGTVWRFEEDSNKRMNSASLYNVKCDLFQRRIMLIERYRML